jgi:NTE family protein
MESFKIGLALGGGGARGTAHIGVLRVLQRAEIPVNVIAGSSAGAVIGAMYAATRDPIWIEQRFRDFLASRAFEQLGTRSLLDDRDPDSVFGQIAKFVQNQLVIVMALNRVSVVKRERLKRAIEFLLPVRSFDELKIPLYVYVTDLNTGRPIRYHSGDLVEAVVQSSSIPGYVSPAIQNGRLLMDGGVSTPIPVPGLKAETDFVIAVDISRGEPSALRRLNMLEIMTRSERITSLHLTAAMVRQADFVIRPDVMGLHWSQFEMFDQLLANGIAAAEQVLDSLKQELRRRQSWRYRWKQWLVRFG